MWPRCKARTTGAVSGASLSSHSMAVGLGTDRRVSGIGVAQPTLGQDDAALAGYALDLGSRYHGQAPLRETRGRGGGLCSPYKPGRPSHSYYSALKANTRLALGVEVMPGNASAPMHRMPGIWAWRDAWRPLNVRPSCVVASPMATNPYCARPRRAISGISRN